MRGLALLLVEKELALQREIYLGNLQWYASMALLGIGKYKSDGIQSYGAFVAHQRDYEKHKSDEDIVSIIARHLKGG